MQSSTFGIFLFHQRSTHALLIIHRRSGRNPSRPRLPPRRHVTASTYRRLTPPPHVTPYDTARHRGAMSQSHRFAAALGHRVTAPRSTTSRQHGVAVSRCHGVPSDRAGSSSRGVLEKLSRLKKYLVFFMCVWACLCRW